MPCLWPLLCVAGNTSSLEASASKVCTLRLSSGFALLCFPAIVHGGPSSPPGLVPEVIPCRRSARVRSEHLRVGRSWFVAMDWLSPASASGSRSRRSSVVATLRSCRRCGCVPRGQRALLDADMLELIDRSACLVEPVVVESCSSSRACAVTRSKHVQRRVRSLLANSPPRGLVEGLLLPESSLRAAPVASLRLLLLDDRDLSPVVHVSLWFLTYFCMYSILGHILRVSTPSQPSVLIQSA